MTKFKAGDTIVGNQSDALNGVEEGQLYTVLEVDEVLDECFLKVDNGKGRWVCSWRFDLYKPVPRLVEQDDPLPPAPKSVRYYHNTLRGVEEDAYLDVHSGNFASGPRIRINDKGNRGITIDADTALQLAHDLTRMAMEIKRRERAQSGE